jgi:hypothetical protein
MGKDKVQHFLAGLAVAVFTAFVWFLASRAGLAAMGDAWLAAVLSSLAAGITKEVADKADNVIRPGMHGVEALDALATAAGSLPVVLFLVFAL